MKNKCPFCLSPNIGIIGPVKVGNESYSVKSSLKTCKSCGLYWIDPKPNEKRLSRIYSEVYHYNPNRFRDFLVSLYSLFELTSDFSLIKEFKREGKVLDIGAGRGDFLLRFPPDKWERWAYDPYLSKADIKLVKKKVWPNVNNYTQLRDYPGDAFDVVSLRNVIEHTSEFNTLLKESHRILKDNGILFIRTPHMGSLDFKYFKNNWYAVTMPGHIVFFHKKSLSIHVRKAGFKVKVNRPTGRSALLSYFRSSTRSISRPIKIGLSTLYSLFSPLFGEGGDLRMIAQK